MSMKNPLTPAGIEPATFRFVAQHLNHCATAVVYRGYTVCNLTRILSVHIYIYRITFCIDRLLVQIIFFGCYRLDSHV